MKKLGLVLIICFSLILFSGGAFAQVTDTEPLTINAVVAGAATLVLGTNTINFASADPDTVPNIAATENPVSVTARVRTGGASTPTLTHIADGPLTNGGDTIAISNVTWTATGAGFVAGTMSDTVDVSAGSWTGSGERIGTFSYSFANSWAYATGTYTQTSTYTLTAP